MIDNYDIYQNNHPGNHDSHVRYFSNNALEDHNIRVDRMTTAYGEIVEEMSQVIGNARELLERTRNLNERIGEDDSYEKLAFIFIGIGMACAAILLLHDIWCGIKNLMYSKTSSNKPIEAITCEESLTKESTDLDNTQSDHMEDLGVIGLGSVECIRI